MFAWAYILGVSVLLRFIIVRYCSLVFSNDRGADNPLDAEADNANAHYGFQRQDNLVVLVNEDAAINPEESEMDNQDQAECEH